MAVGEFYSNSTPVRADFTAYPNVAGEVSTIVKNVSVISKSDYVSILHSRDTFYQTYHSLEIVLTVMLSTGESMDVTQTMNGNSKYSTGYSEGSFKPFILEGCKTTPVTVTIPIEVEPYQVEVPGVYCKCTRSRQRYVSEVE